MTGSAGSSGKQGSGHGGAGRSEGCQSPVNGEWSGRSLHIQEVSDGEGISAG